MSTPHLRNCPKVNCNQKNDCCPFRKIVIPAVMGDDSEDSPSAPENGAYRNALVEYEANGAMYIYASDGIFTKISMVTAEYGAATVAYVDAQDGEVLARAKAYADGIIPTVDVTRSYVNQQDTVTLNAAKAYTDTETSSTLQGAKDYADTVGTTTLASANAAINTAITDANIPTFTMSNVDIGEGAALAANTFYGVYQ